MEQMETIKNEVNVNGKFVSAPEQGGGKLIPKGMGKVGYMQPITILK